MAFTTEENENAPLMAPLPEREKMPLDPAFRLGGLLGDQPQQPQDFRLGLPDAATGTSSYLKNTADNAQAAELLKQVKITASPTTGMATVTAPMVVLQSGLQKMGERDVIQRNYNEMLVRNAARQEEMRKHPFANTLAQLAASFAANDPNPYTRAIGQAAQRLNPPMEQLERERLGMLERAGVYGQAKERTDLERRRFGLEQIRETRLAETAAATQAAKRFGELVDMAQKAELTNVPLASRVLQDIGYPKRQADAQAELLVAASKEAQAMKAAAQAATDKRTADTLAERARESDNRLAVMLKSIQTKGAQQADTDKALEAVAQSLAKGDLSAIRDVTSFRGADRMKLYARAKEINPNFTTSELQRKINMEQSFTVGKDSVGIQSFDTFLQHAGEVTETLKGIELTDSRLLNKSLNWWRRNMKGTPELARLETSLEPVGKEFESFLLNQRALYADDRKQVAMLLNSDQPLKVTMAALNQMGKTAKDRYSAMNQRYKRLMGQDIENPFSNEALTGAGKIGLNLGVTGGTKYPWEK